MISLSSRKARFLIDLFKMIAIKQIFVVSKEHICISLGFLKTQSIETKLIFLSFMELPYKTNLFSCYIFAVASYLSPAATTSLIL